MSTQHYLFHQSGVIPGIGGTFGNCRVDIDEQGTITQSPLHPVIPASAQEDVLPEPPVAAPAEPSQEPPAPAETPVQAAIEEVAHEAEPEPTAQPIDMSSIPADEAVQA